jgi:hypothetical protein
MEWEAKVPFLQDCNLQILEKQLRKKKLKLIFFLHLGELRVNVITVRARNTKGGSIAVPLTSCLTGLESAV